MTTYTATYSPEDNKLRLYASTRLDSEAYERVKAAGFKWAPKQELFVAPMWTPGREDLLLELAGEIEPEGTTLAERAEAKADRLSDMIERKKSQASAFQNAADKISERFYMGQPILVGHHSERKARKDQQRMDGAMRNASKAIDTARWLAYKAEGAEAHANRKNRDDVRARRIKTLLAELRDRQRYINHGHYCKNVWEKISQIEDVEQREKAIRYYSGASTKEGRMSPSGSWSALDRNEVTPEEVLQKSLAMAENTINSTNTMRWIEHILNRLGYERSGLGETRRYEGTFRETLLQMFCREQGADSPKAEKTNIGYRVVSSVPLPLHLADGKELELSEDDWRNLMQSCGYEVEEKEQKKSTQSPLLNLDVQSVKLKHRYGRDPYFCEVFPITKKEYSEMWKDYKSTNLSACGQFKVRTGFKPGTTSLCVFFLTDSKSHAIPETSIVKKEVAA